MANGGNAMAAADRVTEAGIQQAVFDLLDKAGKKGIIYLHIPNGGVHQATDVQRMRNKRLGVRKGAPDVLLFYRKELYVLELKRPDGRLSKAQDEMLTRFCLQGAYAQVAYGIDQAIDILSAWGLLRVEHDCA